MAAPAASAPQADSIAFSPFEMMEHTENEGLYDVEMVRSLMHIKGTLGRGLRLALRLGVRPIGREGLDKLSVPNRPSYTFT